MDQPEEHRIKAASQPGIADGPAAGENPFRLPADQPPNVSVAMIKGVLTGAAISFILGMALAIYFVLSEPDLTWIDWLVRLLMVPVVLASVGGFLGGAVGFLNWVSARFNK